MAFYPYLDKHLNLGSLRKAKVLDIGLGYGTVGQKLAQSSKFYNGLDIARKPVEMMNNRMDTLQLNGKAIQGSMLECPFPDEEFDRAFAIGCFHHTGNMQTCVNQAYRVLKPGGKAMIMVYNKFSFRHWTRWPITTLKNLLKQLLPNIFNTPDKASVRQRKSYDAAIDGEAAPETEFFSVSDIKKIFKSYSDVHIERENCDGIHLPIIKNLRIVIKREWLLSSWFTRLLGLDLYIVATK